MRRNKTTPTLLVCFLLSTWLAACSLPALGRGAATPSASDLVNTALAKTVSALGTRVAAGENPTLGGILASSTPLPALTSTATFTPKPKFTTTPVSDKVCNQATFVRDVTIADNTTIPPNSTFTKTWELKNTGACTWNSGYSVVFAGRGSAMSAPAATPVITNGEVKPGDSVLVSVSMRAPNELGDYEGYWMLRAADNRMFGTGPKGSVPFFVKIHVAEGYLFTEHMCDAQWSSSSGGKLDCPGSPDDSQGSVQKVDDPKLEDNQTHEGQGLLMIAPPAADGYIVGKFPAVIVPDESDFRAVISCDPDANGCFVRFKVTYRVDNGDEQVLGEWNEGDDGSVTQAIKDLDMVAGKSVAFSFYVYVAGQPDQAKAIWYNPRITK